MKTLVIYAHPYDGSFNKSVLDHTVLKLEEKGNTVDVIDLYKDEFNPVMLPSDLKVFGKGEYADANAQSYITRLKEADEVIFIFPIWWYDAPAILKGFFDKVLLKGQAYVQGEDHNIQGILDINKAAIFTTGNISKEIFANLGDPINNVWINGIFGMVGIQNAEWYHCPQVHLEENRNNFTEEINTYLEK